LTVAFAAIGLATTIVAVWGSRDNLWFENDNHLPYQLATVSALLSIALAHTSVLLRRARSDDPQEIALIRVGTICLAGVLAASISIDIVDKSTVADPKLIGVMAGLYALATVALPLMRRMSEAGIADAESIQHPAATGTEHAAPTTTAIPSTTTTRPTSIRPAYASDAEAIAAIYNQGIEERQATFQTRPHDPGELELKTEQLGGQLLVAEHDGRVVGWAGWSGYDDRADYYAGIAECAVYVGRDARGQGVGAALLNGLADEASKFGVHKLVAKIFTSNEPSVVLFRRCGFREVGTHMRHGQLDGQWKDVLVMERILSGA
jgi:L-amino acid N-acyltransferase YncA